MLDDRGPSSVKDRCLLSTAAVLLLHYLLFDTMPGRLIAKYDVLVSRIQMHLAQIPNERPFRLER